MSAGEVVEELHELTPENIFLSPTVTIKIGPYGREYQVHKAVLMHYSEYFRGELEREHRVGKLGENLLSWANDNAVQALIVWMYSKKLPWRTEGWADNDDGCFALNRVVGLNILAHCLIIPELKRPALELAVKIFNSHTNIESCVFGNAFEDLPHHHPFLQLLIDHHCRSYRPDFYGIEDFLAEKSHEAVARVLKKYSEMEDRNIPLKLSDYLKD